MFIVVELVSMILRAFLQVELGVLNAMIGSQQKTSESRKCFLVLFLMAGLVVLRCFEIPLTEAEPRKGRELLAKRGEQKIRKNQVQAICHSPVGHRPKLPTHQQSLGTF